MKTSQFAYQKHGTSQTEGYSKHTKLRKLYNIKTVLYETEMNA